MWKSEITTHHDDVTHHLMDKAKTAKRGTMTALHISQRHGNRLGMLGETTQPVCHHTPHDRSSINAFHLRKELERCTFTPMQSWRGRSQPLLFSPPQFLHLAVRCANVTMHRLLLQPDDIPAVCGSGPVSSIFLVRLLRHLLLHSPIYLITLPVLFTLYSSCSDMGLTCAHNWLLLDMMF